MAIDPRKLRPSELVRLLNSTPLGEVISERQLHRHRSRAGLRIGDGKSIDLLRYVAWLVIERHTPKPEPDGDPYEALKDRARARNAALSLAGRDIGKLPEVVDPVRKEQAESDFCFFCEAYFPRTFYLDWSADHQKVIATIEQAVLEGGLFAMAMPRGSPGTVLVADRGAQRGRCICPVATLQPVPYRVPSATKSSLLLLRFASTRRFVERKHDDFLARHGADVVMHTEHSDASNDLDHRIDLQAGGFNQQTSHSLEQVATLLHGTAFNQVLLRGGHDSKQTNHEKVANEMRPNVSWPSPHVFLLELAQALAHRGFDFTP